jgi:hypothetical protein
MPWPAVLSLFHGTDSAGARSIQRRGVQAVPTSISLDFGPGFYTTTIRRQAESWANRRVQVRGGTPPAAVLEWQVRSSVLAQRLEILPFVIGNAHFWDLVVHCRGGGTDHLHVSNGNFFGHVAGPLARDWRKRLVHRDSDQYTFHGPAGFSFLNGIPLRVHLAPSRLF